MNRSRKSFFLLMSVLILGSGLLGFVRQATVSCLPPGLTFPQECFPGRFGDIPVNSPDDLKFLAEGFPVGQPVPLESSNGTATLLVTPIRAYDTTYLLVALISGIFFWSMATFVFLPRLDLPAVPQFYWITMLYGLGVLVGGVYFQRTLEPRGLFLSLLQVASLAFLPVVFVHLSLIFPVRRPILGWRPNVPWLLYGLAVILVAWQSFAFANYFVQPDGRTMGGIHLAQKTADTVLILQVVLGIALLILQERSLGPSRQRQQVRWLLLGFVLGATPYVFLRTLPALLNQPAPFPAYFDRLFEPAIPLAFVFAIVRYRWLDIDIILRRGILYGILAAFLVVLVLIPVVVLGFGWTGRWPLLVKFIPIIGALGAGLLFQPLRRILGRWIDRTFFKIEHRIDSLVHQLGQELATARSQEEVAHQLHSWILKILDPQSALVAVVSGDEVVAVGQEPLHDCPGPWLAATVGNKGIGQVFAAPKVTTNPDRETREFPAHLTDAGYVLAVPLVVDHAAEGGVYLGPKKSGHRFVGTDLKFLEEATGHASRRLMEIRLVQRVVEERLARQQLDELGQLKDEFLSKVSHDLRTPVTSLGWSLRNLLDGLAGEMNPRQSEYLGTMDQAVTHLDGLVAGLLEISRLEKAEVKILTQPTDLKPVLERAIGTVQPLAEVRRILIALDMSENLPSVIANDDKLAEVMVNLLANAVRYSPDEATVEVRAKEESAKVIVEVRDHGPGFAGIADPFVRFAQGSPSPYSTVGGYGLGLTIAREYLELMGGKISARNHPQGGAEFRIELSTNALQQRNQTHGT